MPAEVTDLVATGVVTLGLREVLGFLFSRFVQKADEQAKAKDRAEEKVVEARRAFEEDAIHALSEGLKEVRGELALVHRELQVFVSKQAAQDKELVHLVDEDKAIRTRMEGFNGDHQARLRMLESQSTEAKVELTNLKAALVPARRRR